MSEKAKKRAERRLKKMEKAAIRAEKDSISGRVKLAEPAGKYARHISLSFKHLEQNSPKFPVPDSVGYLPALSRQLKHMCDQAVEEFCSTYSHSTRNHVVRWSDTSEPNGFATLPPHLRGKEGFQFGIKQHEFGRVIGFFAEQVFFVVWFDPEHNLYPSKS